MKKTTVANVGAVSRQIEMTDVAGEENVASCSSLNNQEIKNFESLDSLYSAAGDGKITEFKRHAEVLDQILTPYGNTILHINITARINQNMDFVIEILKMCPELLWKVNNKGETLLHMAARYGHDDVMEYLLKKCKTTPYNNHHHHDPELGITATWRMLQMTSHEAKDTAMHEAVRYNHLKVVQLLTKEDPKLPYDANKADETPLYLAAERGYKKVVKEILTTCISPADHGPYSRTSLHGAVINNNEGMTKLLLDNSWIQESKQDKQGWTPLHFAAHLGYIKILKMLLNSDKSAAYKADNEGKTPLHIAASRGKVDIMRELISRCRGCCELVDNGGWNVLHFASKSKNRKAVGLILQNPLLGNLVNEKDKKGNTPFLHAASMRFIINHPKVDLQVFNNDNQNAEDMIDPPSFPPWNSFLDIILWFCWASLRIGKGRLFMSKDDHKEGKENRGDPVSSNSNDDGVGKNHLVVAILIATVTFAAGFTVPGGFVDDEGPDQGAAILIKDTAFRAFVMFNTVSMFLSGIAVFNYLYMRPATHKREIYKQMSLRNLLICQAMLAMIGAFLAGTCAVLHNDKILAIVACVMPAAVYLFTKKITKPHRQYIQEKL